MSVLKDVLQGRFWISVAVILLTCFAVSALGGAFIACGITPMDSAKAWSCAAWLIGGFVGVRLFVKEKDGVLLRVLLVVAAAFVLVCLVGLAFEGDEELAANGLFNGAFALGGGLASGLIRSKKKRRGKTSGKSRGVREKKR